MKRRGRDGNRGGIATMSASSFSYNPETLTDKEEEGRERVELSLRLRVMPFSFLTHRGKRAKPARLNSLFERAEPNRAWASRLRLVSELELGSRSLLNLSLAHYCSLY